MKTTAVLLLTLLFSGSLYSQSPLNVTGIATKKFSSDIPSTSIPENSKLTIVGWEKSDAEGLKLSILLEDGITYLIDSRHLKNIKFDEPQSIDDVWTQACLESDTYENLGMVGIQMDMRKELEGESLDFYRELENYDAFFSDDYLEDYLQTLLYRIHNITLKDGRPGNLMIKIYKSTTPNAYSMPNGLIMISTGLLTLIESEEELMSILSHEVAHFVLDHHISNINMEAKRMKRAEFWAGLATIAAAATEVYLASEYDYIPTGNLTIGTALLASTIAYNAADRLGAKYSREQESKADQVSSKLLNYLNVDTSAYRSVLVRLRSYALETGDYGMFLQGNSHPDINKRIEDIGGYIDPIRFNSSDYNRVISMATTYSAIQEYNSMHLETCMKLVNRNISAGVPTEMDYLL